MVSAAKVGLFVALTIALFVYVSFSPATLGIVQSFRDPISEFAAKNIVGNHSHDPPKLAASATARSLRV